MADRDFKGVWIPKEIWLNSALNITDKAILIEIDSLDNGEEGCWAGNKHFAEMLGCTERQASASIAKLVSMNFVKVIRFDGRTRYLHSCLREKLCEADTKNPSGRVTETSRQPDENFYAASPKLPHSNPISNTERNPLREKEEEEERGRARDTDNPYGDSTTQGAQEKPDTVERYAVNNLQGMSERAMSELASFKDDLPEDVIRHGIDNALDKAVRNWSYVRAILNSYAEANVRTVGEAKALDEQRSKKNGNGSPPASTFGIDRRNNKVPKQIGKGIVL